MVEKKYDIEAPEQSHHIESSSSADKSDAEVARQWADDIKRKPEPEAVTSTTKQKNPLAGLTTEELFKDVERFAQEKDLEHILPDLKKGALVAQDPKRFEDLSDLTEEDKEVLRREKTHRWHQPFMMYFMTSMFSFILCRALTNRCSPLCRFCYCAGYGPDCCQWSTRVCILTRFWLH
jgi:uncharacterized protein (DUF885 family)